MLLYILFEICIYTIRKEFIQLQLNCLNATSYGLILVREK